LPQLFLLFATQVEAASADYAASSKSLRSFFALSSCLRKAVAVAQALLIFSLTVALVERYL